VRVLLSAVECEMLLEALEEYVQYQVGSGAWDVGVADEHGWTDLHHKLLKRTQQASK
jgi:hypothetical protein